MSSVKTQAEPAAADGRIAVSFVWFCDGIVAVKSGSSTATALHQAMAGKLMRLEQTQTKAMKQPARFGVIRLG